MLLEDFLEIRYPDVEFIKADGFDKAVIGVNENDMQLVYSVEKAIEILMERDGMEYDQARKFMDFNVIQTYVGENTPIWCQDLTNLI